MFRVAFLVLLLAVSTAAAQPTKDLARLDADAERAYDAGNYEQALRLSEAARQLAEQAPNPESLGSQYARMGAAAEMLGRYGDAAGHFRKLLAVYGKMYGPQSINAAFAMEMLGRVLCKLKQFDEAEKLFKSVADIRKIMIIDGTDAFKSINGLNFAMLDLERGRWPEALARYRAVIDEIVQNGPISTSDSSIVNTDPTNSATFVGLARAAWEIGKQDPSQWTTMLNEAFVGAQWKGRTSASMALAKAAARGGGPRAEQMRKVQDIEAQIQALDAELQKQTEDWLAKIEKDPVYSDLEKKYQQSLPSTDVVAKQMQQMLANSQKAVELSEKYSAALEQCGYAPECTEKYKGLQQQIEALSTQNGALQTGGGDMAASQQLKAQMDARERQIDGYAALPKAREALYERRGRVQGELAREQAALDAMSDTSKPVEEPKPISISEAQASLSGSEALLYYLIGKDETYLWLVTKTDSRWVRSPLNARALRREVSALRCGLDYDGTWLAPNSRCAELLNVNYIEADRDARKPLPFDRDRAYALYETLFGGIADMIAGKSLLVVPSGALAQLPFQVLVSEKPDPAATGDLDRHTHWLIRDHALTVLPSASSLKALRQIANDSGASRPMIGFGNPLLDGPDASYAEWASAAKAKPACPSTPVQQIASNTAEHRGVRAFELNGGLASVEEILAQVPLPETADELCAVAHDLGVGPEDIHLGPNATETEIKRLSEAGKLADYHVVHFATHGALAGQVTGNTEPGLLLTPPAKATALDDGYLTASEIAALKLDADWVILSACNTAAASTEGGEELSGMAQAFFYAGARALLVSHWSVYSEATVKLITKALAAMAADKSVGRAEAMRQSMLALIDTGGPGEDQPAFWAPFVVVGEGTARAR